MSKSERSKNYRYLDSEPTKPDPSKRGPAPHPLVSRHQIRFTPEEWAEYERRGRALGVDAGTWVRMQARKAAGLARD